MLSPRRRAAARAAAALTTAALLAGATAAPAAADPPSPVASSSPVPVPPGLYGKADPTYDGVWRQSLALLALHTVQVTPAHQAVAWLVGQQCADGGWPSYRAGTRHRCTAATEDSNATALAVQALTALGGHRTAVTRGVSWIEDNQNGDGGWSYNPGGTSDADSTALAINALVASGADPATVREGGNSAYDGLAGFQLGCGTARATQHGAFAYQPGRGGRLSPNDLASAQATLAAAGGALPVEARVRKGAPAAALDCGKGAAAAKRTTVPREESAEAASAYLVRQLSAQQQRLMQSLLPGSPPAPDYAATCWAVLGLVAAGHPEQAGDAADWLADNGYRWMEGQLPSPQQGGQGFDPSAAALLVLVAKAAGLDPYNFGGSNLVQLLIDAGPAPAALPAAVTSAAGAQPDGTLPPGSSVTGTGDDDENGGFSATWLMVMALLAGAGAAVLAGVNRRRGGGPAAVPGEPPAPGDPTPGPSGDTA